MVKLASISECTGCMACADICSKKAIRSMVNKTGHLFPTIDDSVCVACGMCVRVCPVINRVYDKKVNTVSKSYATWAKDSVLRSRSASGGAFAAMAKYILSINGVVYGATIDGTTVTHIAVNSVYDLYKIQGSKYQQGDLSGIYKSVKNDLDNDRYVLFSGVPCQIGGLIGFLGKSKYSKLYTVDLVCAGLPSILTIKKFLDEYNDVVGIRSYRDKSLGWKSKGYEYCLFVEHKDGSISSVGAYNVPILAFGSSITNRRSCYNCKYAGWDRISDITIGDLWGDKLFPEQHYCGLSVSIVHNNKGQELIDSSEVEIHEVPMNVVVENNKAIVDGKSNKRYNIFRAFMYPMYKYFTYNQIVNIYMGKGILGLIYKINSKILGILSK